MHDTYRSMIADYIPFLIEFSLVFLPYFVLRPFFPKSSFRVSLASTTNKSKENHTFFVVSTWITKIFYIWAKHYIGYFLNYARFLDRLPPLLIEHIYLMLIMSSAATTISMFLHTLKFKKHIGPKTAYCWYMFSYIATFYSWIRIFEVFFTSYDLAMYTLVGVAINFGPQLPQLVYQLGLTCLFWALKEGALSNEHKALFFIGSFKNGDMAAKF